MQEEFYKIDFHKKLYKNLEKIQTDLDAFMAWYNSERTNQGRCCQGPPVADLFRWHGALYSSMSNENPVEKRG